MKMLSISKMFLDKNLKSATWRTLDEDSMINGISYAKGSRYKAFRGGDFGFLVFAHDSKTPDGDTPGRFIHKY
jgi:hypothetical protein